MHFKHSALAIIAIFIVIFGTHTFFNNLIMAKKADHSTLEDRIKPLGQVYFEGDIDVNAVSTPAPMVASQKARSGKEIYTTSCAACHDLGVLNAPKLNNAADWAPRLKRGIADLVKVAISGKGAMPPKGTCGNCSADELKAAIEHMIQ